MRLKREKSASFHPEFLAASAIALRLGLSHKYLPHGLYESFHLPPFNGEYRTVGGAFFA